MKKYIISSIACLASFVFINSQSYNISKTTETYREFTDGTSVTNNTSWDDPNFGIPVGFDLKIYGQTTPFLYFNDFFFGGVISTKSGNTGTTAIISPLDVDLLDRGFTNLNPTALSPITYKIEGATGAKILKIQWKNAGFFGDMNDNDISESFINFQVWFYESSNNIEFRYGPSSIPNPSLSYEDETGAIIGLWPSLNFTTFLLEGDGAAIGGTVPAEFGYTSYSDTLPRLNGTPLNGTVYKFDYDLVSIKNLRNLEEKITIFPKPAVDVVSISSTLNLDKKLVAIDVLGKKTLLTIEENQIDISTLAAGVYQFQFTVGEGIVNKKVIKL